jgi:hypothetical protein
VRRWSPGWPPAGSRLDFSGTPLAVVSGKAVAGSDLLNGVGGFGNVTSANGYAVSVPARGARILSFTH